MQHKVFGSLWSLLLLQACASSTAGPDRPEDAAVVIEGMIIKNELAYGVTDVMIEVPATGAFAGCGNILARTQCRTTFQDVNYRSNAVLVRWKERGQAKQTGEFVIDVPEGVEPGVPSWVEVVIYGPGQAGARLVQPDNRGR
jgi:hypothetical protein